MVDDINKKLDYLNETRLLIKEAIEAKGPVINEDDTFRSYVDKINNIESLDPNSAKIFSSTDEMYADEKTFIGKKAIIYNRDMMPLNRETTISNIDIPQSFTLSEIPEEDYYANYSKNTTGKTERLYLYLNESEVNLNYEYNSSNEYSYLSYRWVKNEENVYVNTAASSSVEGEAIFGIKEFKQPLTYSSGTWSNLFGEIFKANQSEFYGLYEYTDQYEDTSYPNTYYDFKQVAVKENEITTYKIEYKTKPLYITYIRNKVREIVTSLELEPTTYSGLGMVTEYEEDVPKTFEFYANAKVYVDGTKVKIIRTTYSSEPDTVPTYTKFKFDLINMTVEAENATTVLETRLIDTTTHYIAVIKDYPNEIGSFQAYLTTSGALSPRTYSYSHTDDLGIVITSDYNTYYYRPRYMSAPTQLSSTYTNELFENEVVFAKNGIVKGNKSYLKNIKTNDFYNTWIPQEKLNYGNTNYTKILNYGKSVYNQTLIERQQILSSEVKYQSPENCVTQLDRDFNKTITSLDSTHILSKIYSATEYFADYYRYEDKVYWYALGINWSNADTHEYVNSIYGVVYDAETGEQIYELSDTTRWKPIEPNYYGTMEYFCGVCHATFAHSRNEFVILFDTGTWGWSNGAYAATYKYNVVTKGRSVITSLNVGKHGTGTYYQIEVGAYDQTSNCFFGLIQSFDTDGTNSKNNYLIKWDSSNNVSVVYSDTSSSYALYTSNWWNNTSPDRYSLYPYMSGSDLKIINMANGKVLTINNTSTNLNTSKIAKYNGEIYISYYGYVNNVRTHYIDKLNTTNMTRTNLLTYASDNEYFYFIFVDKQLCVISSSTYKIFSLNAEEKETLGSSNTPIIYGISGIEVLDNQPVSEAYYINVNTGDNKELVKYKKAYEYYVYKEIESFPINGELFIAGSSTSTSTNSSATNMYYSYQLTKQKVNDYQYQKYLDSMDQLLYENEVEE